MKVAYDLPHASDYDRSHCDDHGRDPNAYWWTWLPFPGVDGAVIVCREHGLLAPGSLYEDYRVAVEPMTGRAT